MHPAQTSSSTRSQSEAAMNGSRAFVQILLEAVQAVGDTLQEPLVADDPLHAVGKRTLSSLNCRYDQLLELACNNMYAFKYSEVPHCWIRLYEEAQLYAIKASSSSLDRMMHASCQDKTNSEKGLCKSIEEIFSEIVRRLDMALIKTQGIGRERLIHSTLKKLDLVNDISKNDEPTEGGDDESEDEEYAAYLRESEDIDPMNQDMLNAQQETAVCCSSSAMHAARGWAMQNLMPLALPTQFESGITRLPQIRNPLKKLPSTKSTSQKLDRFQTHRNTSDEPLLIADGVRDWPATTLWANPNYWLGQTHGGRRLVPVEIGSKYTDSGWGQKIMDFETFVRQHLCSASSPNGKSTGYLAQHEFLRQMPQFYKDICVPDFCYINPTIKGGSLGENGRPKTALKRTRSLGSDQLNQDTDVTKIQNECAINAVSNVTCTYEHHQRPQSSHGAYHDTSDTESVIDDDPSEIKINIWLGPANTVSPAHTDPHHNILAQVMGRKYVRLYSPLESSRLYPMENDEAHQTEATQALPDAAPFDDSRQLPTRAKSLATEGECELQGGRATNEDHVTEYVDMSNTSRVDIGLDVAWIDEDETQRSERLLERDKQSKTFPRFDDARYQECILEAGDCLFIPRGWWHYIQSLDVSASVSFWWD